MTLTQRDRALLCDVWRYRYLTSMHVARLHFGNRRLAQRRLRLLAAGGFVDRFRSAGAVRAGFRTWWYRLTRSSARIVAEIQGLPVESVAAPQRSPASLRFLAHHGLVTDFRLWVREACVASQGFGYQFVPSYEEVRERGQRRCRIGLKLQGHRRLLLPDGAMLLTRAERRVLFLLEVDRGTEPLTGRHPSAISHKFARYRDAYDTKEAERYYGSLFQAGLTGFRILCLVPDKTREAAFLDLAQQIDLVPLVWVATQDQLTETGTLNAMLWATEPLGERHCLAE